jgi:fumarate reductase subunit D
MAKQKPKMDEKETLNLFPLGKENYKLLIVGLGIIILGFILMIGGGSDDPNVFNEEIFSFRRITVAPLIVLFGFIFEIYAIMKKPKVQ